MDEPASVVTKFANITGRMPSRCASNRFTGLLMSLQLQTRVNQNLRAFKLAAAAIALFIGAASAWAAPEAHPFAALTGQWSGGGIIKKSNGTSERIRCRSAYEPAAGTQLQLRLRCASDSYNFDLSAVVAYEGGAVSGSWNEAGRNLNGSIQGRSTGNGRQMQVVAQSIAFTSNLTLNTRGDKQSIVIQSPGTEVSEVSITLDRK
jgi:hypothetical protein